MAAVYQCAEHDDRTETKELDTHIPNCDEDETDNSSLVTITQSVLREVGSGRSKLIYEEE